MKTIRSTPHGMGGLLFALIILCLLNARVLGAAAGNLDQAQNGGVGATPIDPVDWINGNSNGQKSHFVEGESIPYRLVLTGLSVGSHVVDIEWDIRKSSKATIDYITSVQRINETVNPLKGLVGTFGAPSTFPIPPPPVSTTTGTVGGQPQPLTSFSSLPANQKLFSIYNGTISSIAYINNADGNLGSWSVSDSSQRIRITLNASAASVVLAWGGHIGSRRDWGDGNSATSVPGSPYHTRFIALDGSGGNQDRALAAAAVCMPPNCAISGPTSVCTATPQTYTALTDGTGNTFLWTVSGNGTLVGSATGPSVQVAAGAPGTYTLSVTINRPLTAGGCGTTCSQTVTVNGLPSCSISRLNDPSAQSVGATLYQGPAGMAQYTWTVSYNGDPATTAGGNQPSITLADPTAQGSQTASVTVGLTVTDANGCTSSCVRTFQAPGECIIKPPATCPRSQEVFTYGGDPTGMSFVWSIVTPGSPVSIVGANNQPSVTLTSPVCTDFTLRLETTAADGFVTICETTGAFVDTTRPVLGNLPVGRDLGCNPTLPVCSTSVTALDDCDGDISARVVCTPGAIVENGACNRSQSFIYSVADSCGNVTSASVTYTWKQDTTAPVLSNLPISRDLGCNPALPRCSETVTALDDCDGNLTAQIVCTPGPVVETSACGRSRAFVYTVSDTCGNQASATVTLTWREDVTPPVISNLPAGGDLGCNPILPTCSNAVTARDVCDGDVTASVVCTPGPIVNINGCARSQTFTYVAQDSCGNQVRNEVNYTWREDTTPPVFSNLPISGDLGCNPALPRCSETVTALDSCDGNLTSEIVCTPGPIIETSACGRSRTFVYTVSDTCGNQASATVTLTWREDVTPPVISNLPIGGDLGCNPTLPTCSRDVTARDLCEGDVTASVVCTPGPIVNIDGCARSQTFTYVAQDSCGNQIRNEVNYTWREDTTAPVFGNLPIGGDLGCNPTRPSCSISVTARDTCDGDLSASVVCTPGPVIELGRCRFTQTFTYTVRDTCGNLAQRDVIYLWSDDNVAPVMANLPVGRDLGCNPTRPTCSTAVTALDNCDGDLTASVTCTPGPIVDINGCSRSQSFTYRVQDACGNAASVQISYTWKEDVTPPVLANLPSGGNLGCNPTRPSCSTAVTARDNCDGDLSAAIVCTPGPVEEAGRCGFSQVFTYSVQDLCGNLASATVTYTWKEDTTAPELANLPVGADLGCNPIRPVCSVTVTARDLCDGDVTARVVCTPGPIVNEALCRKSQTFTYSVSDLCGNATEARVTYTWIEDTVPPRILCPTVESPIECPGTPVFPDATVTDDCDPAPAMTHEDVTTRGSCPQNYRVTRTWTAVDACGNRASCSATIEVRDTLPPIVTWPGDVNLACSDCDIDPAHTGTPTAEDLCGTITITHSDSISGTCPKRVERRWTVSDGCNEVSHVQIIQCLPSTRVVVTDSSLCTYDMDPTTGCKDFRLLFTQDALNFPQFKVTASNPGQTYFNLFYNGRPGTVVTLNLTIPYPYVTQGAQPIHAYDGVSVVPGASGQECYIPGNGFFVNSTQVVLSNYAPQTMGSSTTVSVTLTVPSTGFVYLNMHLDYGLKRSSGYAKGGPSGNDAIDPTTLQVLIPDRGSYRFAFSDGVESASDSICNINVFKKVAGVGGMVAKKYTTYDGVPATRGIEGASLVLKDAKGLILANGKTDSDGWYFCNYKWTGKSTTLYLTLTPPGAAPQTQPVTLKANGYAQLDFEIP